MSKVNGRRDDRVFYTLNYPPVRCKTLDVISFVNVALKSAVNDAVHVNVCFTFQMILVSALNDRMLFLIMIHSSKAQKTSSFERYVTILGVSENSLSSGVSGTKKDLF